MTLGAPHLRHVAAAALTVKPQRMRFAALGSIPVRFWAAVVTVRRIATLRRSPSTTAGVAIDGSFDDACFSLYAPGAS